MCKNLMYSRTSLCPELEWRPGSGREDREVGSGSTGNGDSCTRGVWLKYML